MVMRGIDISNWQSGLQPSKMNVDFCICKATEGTGFVDKYCDSFISDCRKHKIPFGFYHFAGGVNARKEAEFFYDNCRGYFGKGIPVLDFEIDYYSGSYGNLADNNRTWCEQFLRRVHDLSGVWPMLYISASRCSQYHGSWIPDKCGLWIAGYPYTATSFIDDPMPYDIEPWPFAAIWQFSNQLILPGYVGKLDGDLAYMDKDGWAKYAGKAKEDTTPKKTIDDMALETILGEYGTGDERKKLLGKNYDAVQKRVNELYKIAHEVLEGKWGNDWNREQALSGAGYPYETVQLIVNSLIRYGE